MLPVAELGARSSACLQRYGELVKRKAFVSSIFASLAVFALVALMSVLFVVNSGFENVQLESRLTSERFDEVVAFVNNTQDDALLDQLYASACQGNQNYCADSLVRFNSYFDAAKSQLNDSAVNVSLSPQTPDCTFNSQPGQGTTTLLTFNVDYGYDIAVASKHAFKLTSIGFPKSGSAVVSGAGPSTHVDVTVNQSGAHFSYDCP